MASACSIRVHGVVQGVGFRPFVYRLARANTLGGWVLNREDGVEIYLEGAERGLQEFVRDLESQSPPAASIARVEINPVTPLGLTEFTLQESKCLDHPSTGISPDLAVCDACLRELFDPADPRYLYPYINCTNCGPRYTVVLELPYDRCNTTMRAWQLDELCAVEYADADNRRFHAQPLACSACGPGYKINPQQPEARTSQQNIAYAAKALNKGKIIAIKGLGGYHLACDARNVATVNTLRERKFRKDKPFAVMACDLEEARQLVRLSSSAEKLLASCLRPIVLAPAQVQLDDIAPGNHELGVMLPYAPLHHLLFAAGAPRVLVMTSGNRSSEPIAYEDDDAKRRLADIVDMFLVGERPIARRVDDSVVRDGVFGPAILRRSRGYAPGAVAALPVERPILALGADLKNSVTLVVECQAFVSQYIGDLEHYESLRAFKETIDDLISMYDVSWEDLLVVHDSHPQYASTNYASTLPACEIFPVQHHRAHVASVLAERGVWDKEVVGVSFDGTGYGDDGGIWGGEVFVGSVQKGFTRVAHLREATLPGGDAAARYPVQAAAGFLLQLGDLPEMTRAPFQFPAKFTSALDMLRKNIRSFPTTSVGRLFDTIAALLGFTRDISFEGQAAMSVEHLARQADVSDSYDVPFNNNELDFRPVLQSIIHDRQCGRDAREIARAFQRGLATGLTDCVLDICSAYSLDTVVLSGGVFQNELLLEDLHCCMSGKVDIWTNHAVPANDGGISLGQAAMAAFHKSTEKRPCTNSPLQ